MFYLIYISSAVKPMNYDDLTALLQQCRENNEKLGITGILLYQQGTFLQMLEGEQQAVMDLYHAITLDPRHTAVHTVMSGDSEGRIFSDWSMGFFNMDKAGEFPRFADFIDDKLDLSAIRNDAENAYEFIVQFNNIISAKDV